MGTLWGHEARSGRCPSEDTGSTGGHWEGQWGCLGTLGALGVLGSLGVLGVLGALGALRAPRGFWGPPGGARACSCSQAEAPPLPPAHWVPGRSLSAYWFFPTSIKLRGFRLPAQAASLPIGPPQLQPGRLSPAPLPAPRWR